jgi:predicted TIM-barrel fold metal-dependent hydrolase
MIPFVDAHHHLWDLSKPYQWLEREDPAEAELLGDYAAIRQSYLIGDYLTDIAMSDVVASVHIQADYSGSDQAEETAWLQSVADKHRFPHGIIAYCNLAADDAGEQLDRHCAHRNMRGVRTHTEGLGLLGKPFQRGIARLGERGLVYDMQISHESMGFARQLADAHPDVQFVLEHAGLPLRRDDHYYLAWHSALTHLAGAPNVTAKISGLGMTDHHWSEATIRRWALTVIETFGVERSMFGSNWPVDSLYSDYRSVAAAYHKLIAELSTDEQHLLLHLNAERVYDL